MIILDPIIKRELTVIHQIILDETWLEAERRGCHVSSRDRVVSDNVCAAVLRIGARMRANAVKEIAAAVPDSVFAGDFLRPDAGFNRASHTREDQWVRVFQDEIGLG